MFTQFFFNVFDLWYFRLSFKSDHATSFEITLTLISSNDIDEHAFLLFLRKRIFHAYTTLYLPTHMPIRAHIYIKTRSWTHLNALMHMCTKYFPPHTHMPFSKPHFFSSQLFIFTERRKIFFTCCVDPLCLVLHSHTFCTTTFIFSSTR